MAPAHRAPTYGTPARIPREGASLAATRERACVRARARARERVRACVRACVRVPVRQDAGIGPHFDKTVLAHYGSRCGTLHVEMSMDEWMDGWEVWI